MTKRRGAISDNGFIFKKINENEKKILQLIGSFGSNFRLDTTIDQVVKLNVSYSYLTRIKR